MKPTRMSTASAYPARMSDELWAVLEPLVPAHKPGGRPPKYTRRAILDAILYAVRQGCTWRALPPDLPYWNTAFWYFQEWQKDGTWDRIEDVLRRQVRTAEGRDHDQPSAGVADSQTVKGTEQPGPRGFDGGKKNHRGQAARVRGHPRAGVGAGGHAKAASDRLVHVWADPAYRGFIEFAPGLARPGGGHRHPAAGAQGVRGAAAAVGGGKQVAAALKRE